MERARCLRWLLALALAAQSLLGSAMAAAQDTTPRGATLYLTSVSSSTPPAVPEQPQPHASEPVAPRHEYRRGSYLLAVGLGLVAGALTHAAFFAAVEPCGIRRPSRIADGLIAAVGLGVTFGGGYRMKLSAPSDRTLSPLTKSVGVPGTALGVMAATMALTSFGSLVDCIEFN